MSEILKIQEEIIEEFSFFDNWSDKYAYIIDNGKTLDTFPEDKKKDCNKIKGCQSQVWLCAERINDKVFFQADSDALIVKGLIAFLIRVYSGRTAEDILNTEPFFISKIEMEQHLSPTRSNGLLSMIKQFKYYALALKATSNS